MNKGLIGPAIVFIALAMIAFYYVIYRHAVIGN